MCKNSSTSIPVAARFKAGFSAAHLVRLWVRIPPGAWMSMSCGYCVFGTGRGLCVGPIPHPEELTESVCECH